jgi:AraC family transcriptional regulator of adaptative response/methylated-DNA-[protein]-cysteine methyltransferase
VEAQDPQLELVRRACRYIEANPEGSLTLEEISAEVGLSPHHLQRTFKRVMGITPRQYAEACRLGRFKAQIKGGETVTRAIYDAGYGSSSRLYERAPAQLGMTPTAYRKGGPGMNISYTIVDSPLGLLLVAATEKGICGISLGDSERELEEGLRREYPAAQIGREEGALSEWVGEIVSHLEGKQPNLDLPLDVQATAFQWQVWEKLRTIPYGSTRSYGEIAKAIGRPTASRAVAQACGSNRTALLIPCHRVVQENGGLGGYRWGIERKRALLEQERTLASESKEEIA